jgi:ferredoxin
METTRKFRVALDTPDGRRIVDCAEDEFIWDAAAAAGVLLPAICHQGRCLTCAARLLQGDVDQTAASGYFPEDRQAGYVLLCTARPRSDLLLETHQEDAMRAHRLAHRLPAPYS